MPLLSPSVPIFWMANDDRKLRIFRRKHFLETLASGTTDLDFHGAMVEGQAGTASHGLQRDKTRRTDLPRVFSRRT